MRTAPRVAVLVAVIAAIALVIDLPTATAELENLVFTSKQDGLQLVVPRGWRATDLPSYPGLLLWMMHSQPDGKLVLTSDSFTHAFYCSWPIQCRSTHESPAKKFACAVRQQLQVQRMRMQDVQAGPKENEEAGLPSVWFEYDDGRHFFRQAFVVTEDHAISLVLSAPSLDARSQHVRAFEQTLRSMHLLSPEELGTTAPAVQAMPAASSTATGDAGVGSAAPLDGGLPPAAPLAPKVNPIGPCS